MSPNAISIYSRLLLYVVRWNILVYGLWRATRTERIHCEDGAPIATVRGLVEVTEPIKPAELTVVVRLGRSGVGEAGHPFASLASGRHRSPADCLSSLRAKGARGGGVANV